MTSRRTRVPRLAVALAGQVLCLLTTAVFADDLTGRFRAYVDGPWGQIHVRVDGPDTADAPSVLLLHQMVWSSLQFEHIQPLLAARGIRSIAVDLPGYGLSDGPSHVPTAAEYAASLLPVLERFGITRAIIHGNHTGATIAVAFADAHPERVDRLILQGPPIFDAPTRRALLAEKPFDQTPRADGSHFLQRWQQASSSFGANTSLASRHRSVLEFFTAGPREWYAHDAVFRYELAPAIERLSMPTLLLTNPGDSLHGAARQVSDAQPTFAYVELAWPGAHAIYDDPEPWADAVAAYVQMVNVSPAVQAYWRACGKNIAEPPADGFYRVRNFGDDPQMADRLLDLILRGEKTVTFPTPWLYDGNRNATPVVGGYTVVTSATGNPKALLRTISARTLPFNEVTEADTRYEGPGARPLEAWREIHWAAYSAGLRDSGRRPSQDMPVTVERFELVCSLQSPR